MFVLVTALSLPLGWAAYSLNWMRQRHEARQGLDMGLVPSPAPRSAPAGLWLLGEEGVRSFHMINSPPERVEVLQQLFPEAEIQNVLLPTPPG